MTFVLPLQASDGFQKLQYLLMQNPFPPETFGNLLLLYCKYEYYDLAADVLAENADLTYRYLTPVRPLAFHPVDTSHRYGH